jgi:CzcA family heavy metal efflux pump
LRSKSVLGLSSVVLIFREGSDVIRARQLVQERVATVAPRLPASVRPPVMLPPLSATSRAMKIGISSARMDQMAMSEVVRWTVRPRLMAVPGVANVAVWGQRDRQLQVLVDPARLAVAGVTLAEVQRAAGDASVSTGGGFVDTPNQRLAVRHMSPVVTPEDLSRTVIKLANGAPIRLGDVATLTEGHAAPIGDAIINDKPGLLLIVEKQQGGNTLDVTQGVEKALAELRPALHGLDVDSTIFRPATFIERSLSNLSQAMWLGCALVALVLILFTRDWRSATISLIAIPLSLLGAALALSWMGASINTMVIAGLVIALGEIVDDAIIDVENIGRRLRLNREAGNPRSSFDVVLGASLEVRTAVFASLIVIMVFLPIFFLDGLSGTFFRPLATAYVLAIATSLLVALTITPALCLFLLPGARERREDPGLVRTLKGRYRAFLPRMIGRPQLAMGIVAGGLLVAAIGYVSFKDQFLPDFRETDFLMHFVEKPGTSIEAMDRITILASKELRAIPGVRNFGSHIGRAEAGDEVYGPNFTELWISLDESADYDASVTKIKEAIDGYPGLTRDVLTYLRERIKEVLTGAGATVVVRIYGPDMAELRATAARVKGSIADVPGVADLKVEQQSLIPQIQILPRPEALAAYGLTTGAVRRATETIISGTRAGEVYRDDRSYEVAVWGTPEVRGDLHALRDMLIPTGSGAQVRLREVADVRIMPAANEIKRENGSRRIDVTMNIGGASDLGSVARTVQENVTALKFEPGYYPEFLGEYAALQASQRQLLFLSGLCLIGILLLIWLEFRSLRITALIGLSLPFALLGGVIAVLLSGGTMSLGSLVGFVTVLGISARNALMLISHYKHLETQEGETFGPAMIVRGAEERLVPILMTASCAALALLPLVVNGDAPGHEIEHPMALVILGGLVSSTALNLLLMPTLYARFARRPSGHRPVKALPA